MSSVSTIGQNTFLNSQIMNIETQLDTLSNQVSSGNKSDTFSGINTVSQLSLQLTNEQTAAQGYLTNISNAQTLINPIQSVLQQITDIANQLRTDALSASSDALPVTQGSGALQAEANDALNQISALLNTRVGSTYLFGGRNTSTPPMPNFGSLSNASSIVGQAAALQTTDPLTNVSSTGDTLYDAIQNFLNNGITKTTSTGATVPAPFGYTGETGEPGGSDFRFTTSAAASAGSTTITVAQGFDLPVVGDYIEFGTLPPTNAAYQVTAVNTATRQITFARQTGGTAMTQGEMGATTAAALAAATTLNVGNASNFSAGQTVTIAGNSYTIASVNTGAKTITLSSGLVAGIATDTAITTNGLDVDIPAGTSVNVYSPTAVTTVGASGTNTTDKPYPQTTAAALAGAGSVTVPTSDISQYSVGESIQFASNPGVNYTVLGVKSATGAITFGQAAGTDNGTTTIGSAETFTNGANTITTAVPNDYPVGATFVSAGTTYTVSSVVGTTVTFSPPYAGPTGAGTATITCPPAAAGATSFSTFNTAAYAVGDLFTMQGVSGVYQVTSIGTNTVNFQAVPNPPGGGLASGTSGAPNASIYTGLTAAVPSGTAVLPASASVTLAAGTTTIPVATPANYHVGDAISFASAPNLYYSVTAVNASASPPSIVVSQIPAGGGLATSVNTGTDTITDYPSYQAGSSIINVGSTTGVTAGMSVKFSNSTTAYTVSAVINSTSIQIVPLGQSQGGGLETTIPAVVPVAGQQVTAQFGAAIQPLSVQIDNGVALSYGIPADAQAFRKVMGAIFALATTNLNTTTETGFREIAARAAADLQTGSSEVTTLASDLGVKQQTLDATQTRQQNFVTTLQAQLSNLNDVNMAQAVSQLTQTQTQLQASFQLLSTMKNLTLANYL